MIVTCTVVETNSASVSIHTQGKIKFKKNAFKYFRNRAR